MKSLLDNCETSNLVKFILLIFIFSKIIFAGELSATELNIAEICNQDNCSISSSDVRENFKFYGLASYYNNIHAYLVDKHGITDIEAGSETILSQGQWLVIAGRLEVLVIQAPGLQIEYTDKHFSLVNYQKLQQKVTLLKVAKNFKLATISPELDQVRYAHLWKPLAWLAKLVEFSIVALETHVIFNWGMAIVVFSIIVKLLLFPLSIITTRLQREVSLIQAKLAPQVAEIKSNYDGEEAHNRLMAAHKALGVSPFFTLKPMLGTLIQIPILIAVFNALGEMPQLNEQSFLWIDNLAYPDAVGHISNSIPMFGTTISLLPFIMTVVTIISVILLQNNQAPQEEVKKQKRNLYLMAATFFVLFYAFPAAMVLYWTLINLWNIMQQQLIKF